MQPIYEFSPYDMREETFPVTVPDYIRKWVEEKKYSEILDDYTNNLDRYKQLYVLKSIIFLGELKIFELLLDISDKTILFEENNFLLKMAASLCDGSHPRKYIDCCLIAKLLVENNADVCVSDNYCIRIASRSGAFDIIKLLLDNGADIHADNDYPLKCAVYYGNLELFMFLHANGADLYAGGGEVFRTAMSIRFKNHVFVKYFLDNGFDVNFENGYVLKKSISNKQPKTIEMLLKNGADINFLEQYDLVSAIKSKSYKIVELLVNYGCDFTVLNSVTVGDDAKQKIINLLASVGVSKEMVYNIMIGKPIPPL